MKQKLQKRKERKSNTPRKLSADGQIPHKMIRSVTCNNLYSREKLTQKISYIISLLGFNPIIFLIFEIRDTKDFCLPKFLSCVLKTNLCLVIKACWENLDPLLHYRKISWHCFPIKVKCHAYEKKNSTSHHLIFWYYLKSPKLFCSISSQNRKVWHTLRGLMF